MVFARRDEQERRDATWKFIQGAVEECARKNAGKKASAKTCAPLVVKLTKFLQDKERNRDLMEFRVVCDHSNNTKEDAKNKMVRLDVWIKWTPLLSDLVGHGYDIML